MQVNPWVAHLHKVSHPRLNLVCLPFSGAGSSAYRPFSAHLPVDTALWSIRLPGREHRFSEPANGSVDDITEHVYAALQPALHIPTVLFGHSMGTLLAYRLAQKIEKEGGKVARLVVSARGAPHIKQSRTLIHKADRATILAELKSLGGTPKEFFNSAELQDLVLPTLRADFKISETYVQDEPLSVNCDLVAIAAEADTHVRFANVDQWQAYTNGHFQLHRVPGGHFHIFDDPARTIRLILDGLVN